MIADTWLSRSGAYVNVTANPPARASTVRPEMGWSASPGLASPGPECGGAATSGAEDARGFEGVWLCSRQASLSGGRTSPGDFPDIGTGPRSACRNAGSRSPVSSLRRGAGGSPVAGRGPLSLLPAMSCVSVRCSASPSEHRLARTTSLPVLAASGGPSDGSQRTDRQLHWSCAGCIVSVLAAIRGIDRWPVIVGTRTCAKLRGCWPVTSRLRVGRDATRDAFANGRRQHV